MTLRIGPHSWEAVDVTKPVICLRRAGCVAAAVAGLAFLAAGCGHNAGGSGDEAKERIKLVGILYGRYSAKHKGQGPKSEQDFKDFIRKLPAEELPPGVDPNNLDTLLTSPRDGKPYGIVYGAVAGAPGPGGAPVIVYEQVGSAGKHMVVRSTIKVDELDDASLKQALPGAG